MARQSPMDSLRNAFEFDMEEPGTLILLILLFAFLAFSPKDGCSFHHADDVAPAAEQSR
ncbi:MAG: hypothetical protein ACI81R_003501 [Bradymonadia bacterium]|jgi:hypothetical protein